MDKLMIVSADSHAIAPPESWQDYVEARYHEYLPQLEEENRIFTTCMGPLNGYVQEQTDVYDFDGAYRSGGVTGLWDADVRIREMDREGIAAEIVYTGDPRATDLFHAPLCRTYPLEVCDAGMRAYHRWAHDTFGRHGDRILLVGVTGTCTDMDATLAEIDWIADHGFVGTFVPGNTVFPGMRPLERPLLRPLLGALRGAGTRRGGPRRLRARPGLAVPRDRADHHVGDRERRLGPGSPDADHERRVHAGIRLGRALPPAALAADPRWGVRPLSRAQAPPHRDPGRLDAGHPGASGHRLRGHRRDELPATRRPSEYWGSNGLTSLSFVHSSEVEMRHEIGLDTLAFGRDFPHAEGTWPNTMAWLVDAFGDLPETETRQILGENIVRFLGLDRTRLQGVADRVGPEVGEIVGKASELSPELLAHFDLRGGYLKKSEGAQKLSDVDVMVQRTWPQPRRERPRRSASSLTGRTAPT